MQRGGQRQPVDITVDKGEVAKGLKAFGENKRFKGAGREGFSTRAFQGGGQVNAGQLKRDIVEFVKACAVLLTLGITKVRDIVPEGKCAPVQRVTVFLQGVCRKNG